MRWLALYHVLSTLLHLWRLLRSTSVDKDLEILLLRHQWSIYERKYDPIIRPSRPDKVLLTSLMKHIRLSTHRTLRQLQPTIRIVKPETVIGWHRQLVQRK